MRIPSLLLLSCMFLSYVPKLTLSQDIPTFTPSSAILFPGQQVVFMCNTTADAFVWIINNDNFFGNQLQPEDGVFAINKMLFINMSVNATLYGCGSVMGNNVTSSEKSIVFVAAAPDQVPDVIMITDTFSITLDDIVTLTLSWGEPFNNFDPIVNYTVSCLGDNVTCPPNFTTIDNATRSYTITNLTPMTNYTFSVVATNSIGSGEAGVVMITTPSLPDIVTGVMLICEVMDQINQCTVDWDPITVGNGLLEQPLVYEVYYNGTRQNVTSPTTTLTFTAPSLSDGLFVDNITVIVTAINRFGRGSPSEPDYFEIMSSSVTDAVTVITPEDETNRTYSITVTCTINPYSDADMCEVIATINGQTLTDTASITNGMATVTINGLACGVPYTIIAGGTLGGDLVGPRSSHGTTMGPCPLGVTPTIVPTTSMTITSTPTVTPSINPPDTGESTDSGNGAAIGGGVGGAAAAIIIIIIIIIVVLCCIKKREKSSRPTSPGDKVGFRPASGVKVQTLDRYGKPVVEGENTDTGVELTGYTSKSPELTVTQIPSYTATSTGQATTFQGNDYQTAPLDEKNRTPSAFMPEGSYDTLAPADEPPAPSAQVIPPAQNGSNPNAPKLNYAELEQFTRKPASVKKPEPQPSSQYAVIDPKSLQQGTYT